MYVKSTSIAFHVRWCGRGCPNTWRGEAQQGRGRNEEHSVLWHHQLELCVSRGYHCGGKDVKGSHVKPMTIASQRLVDNDCLALLPGHNTVSKVEFSERYP